jgi:hypothetical protein
VFRLGCALTCVWPQGEVSVWYPALAFGFMKECAGPSKSVRECRGRFRAVSVWVGGGGLVVLSEQAGGGCRCGCRGLSWSII